MFEKVKRFTEPVAVVADIFDTADRQDAPLGGEDNDDHEGRIEDRGGEAKETHDRHAV